jgi:hypothetical protein
MSFGTTELHVPVMPQTGSSLSAGYSRREAQQMLAADIVFVIVVGIFLISCPLTANHYFEA